MLSTAQQSPAFAPRVVRSQRDLVAASLLARPGVAKPTHRRWAV
ncbi:MAG: hypothetical protein QOE28_187 [Solirubrobacteraceae bacterium]|jgi:hypothetical protein|nr:hypothetical protein [Solirubrobacteraceae bacterium]